MCVACAGLFAGLPHRYYISPEGGAGPVGAGKPAKRPAQASTNQSGCARRYPFGVCPLNRLNHRAKYVGSVNPRLSDNCPMLIRV